MRKGNQPTDLTLFANALREVLGLDKLYQKPSKLRIKPADPKDEKAPSTDGNSAG